MPAKKSKVVVVGSLNIDQVFRVADLPARGETVTANDFQCLRGGKGANQAISAARQNVDVAMIGCVGKDDSGTKYVEYLEKEEGIDVTGISKSKAPTGTAFIAVEEDSGENTIIVAGGANEGLSRSLISDQQSLIESASVLLVQLEIPVHSVIEAINIATRSGVPVVLNPSPMIPNFPWDDFSIPYVIVNETEVEELLDFQPDTNDLEFVRQEIYDRRIENLIVTRGSETTLVYTREGDFYEVEPLPVLPIDTVGAGDAFAGCFAARIAGGESVEDGVRAANCAGALTTLGGGAQNPVPDREKVDLHVEQIPKRKKFPGRR